ncbi:dentin sialophosphoprotein-like isoform X2 [Mya arenaria]|uniref:dentin sialophosphoprotein-like isoform X2 n=1 Tax=Mya arenaria TaxID=6604 RepID=UPI0022E301E9|nr:dentin sialophosphoprotein-like isoform X2 [Mya arenaria]
MMLFQPFLVVVLSGIAVDSTPFRFKHAISHPPVTTAGENPAGEELGDKGDNYDPNKEWFQYSKGLCPLGQVPQRNDTVCCLPTACPPNKSVTACHVNGTEDTCVVCQQGYIQPNNISSLNMSNAACFLKTRKHDMCPIEEFKMAATGKYSVHLPYPCECNTLDCRWPRPQSQQVATCRIVDPCEPGFTLKPYTGVCEQCRWFEHKLESGCHPCAINITLLRQGHPDNSTIPPTSTTPKPETTPTTPKPETTTELVTTQETEEPKDDPKTLITTVLISCVGGLLIVILIGCVVICFIKHRRPGSGGKWLWRICDNTDSNDSLLPSNPSSPVTPTTTTYPFTHLISTSEPLSNGTNGYLPNGVQLFSNGVLYSGHLPSVLVSVNGTLPNGNANVNSQVIRDGNGNVNSYIVNSEGQVLLKGGDDKDFVSESDGNRPRNLEIGNGHIPTGRGTANGICRLYNGTGVSKDGNIVSDLQELGVTPRNATDDSAGEFAEVLTDETRANIANVQHLRAPGDGVKPTKDSNKENSINSVNSEMQHYMDHLNATEASGEKVNDMSKEQLNTSILRQAMEKGDLDVSLIHSPDNDKDHSDAERTYICMDSEAGRKAVIGKYGDLDTQSGVKGGSKLKDSVSGSGNKSHVKAVSVSGNKSDVKAEAVGLREFASSGMIKQESADDRNVTFKDAKPDIGKRETRQKTNGGIVFNKCKINCTTLIINNGTGNGQPDVEFDDSEESDGSSASDPDSSDGDSLNEERKAKISEKQNDINASEKMLNIKPRPELSKSDSENSENDENGKTNKFYDTGENNYTDTKNDKFDESVYKGELKVKLPKESTNNDDQETPVTDSFEETQPMTLVNPQPPTLKYLPSMNRKDTARPIGVVSPIQAPVQGHPLRPENSFSEGQPSSMIYGVAHFSEQSDIADGRQLDSLVHSNRLPRNHSNRVESGIHSPDNHQAVSGGNSSVRSSGGTNTPSHLRMDELKSYPLEGESNSGDMNGDSLLPESSLEVNYNVVTDSGLGDDVAGRNNEQSNSLDRNVPNVLERQEPEGMSFTGESDHTRRNLVDDSDMNQTRVKEVYSD